MSDSDIVRDFLIESSENLDRLDQYPVGLEKNPQDKHALAGVFRTTHTIKGTCGFLGFNEAIKDPLTHLVRNSVDHGIEFPQDRVHAGKDPAGRLILRAFHEGDQVIIEIGGDSALGVVMTGMGSDGVLGAQRLREAGGEVIIQGAASSVVWGMPGLVYAAGAADGVDPLNQLAQEITRRVLQSRAARSSPTPDHRVTLELQPK